MKYIFKMDTKNASAHGAAAATEGGGAGKKIRRPSPPSSIPLGEMVNFWILQTSTRMVLEYYR